MNKQFILVKAENGEALVAVEQIKTVEYYAQTRKSYINLVDNTTSVKTTNTATEIHQMIKEAQTPPATQRVTTRKK